MRLKRRFYTGLLLTISLLFGCKPSSTTLNNALVSPAAPASMAPHLSHHQDGSVILSWLEPAGSATALRYSTLDLQGWSAPRTVAQGADWFVNWTDFPSVIPITNEIWAAHWLIRRPGKSFAYDVALAVSRDSGQSWELPITPHKDNTNTEHGFVSLFPWQQSVGAIWLDGRNFAADVQPTNKPVDTVGTSLRFATIDADSKVTNPQIIDALVCDCCQTDTAITDNGPIAVYRNRTSAEIRDIYVSRAVDGVWQAGQAVAKEGWEISGCPVNGPAIAAKGHKVATAWFTAPNFDSSVRFAQSLDGGKSFSQAIDLDIDEPIGRVDVALLNNGKSVVSWLRSAGHPESEICARTIGEDGQLGPIQVIAKTKVTPPAGFPQMALMGTDLIFAWTDISGQRPSVKTARLAIHALQPSNGP